MPAAAPAAEGPGSGTGRHHASNNIYSDSVTVNFAHKWVMELTAIEPFSNGRVIYEIPPGWSPPQTTSMISAGFVTDFYAVIFFKFIKELL